MSKNGEVMRIVNTDNFSSDYPNEFFINIPPLPYEKAKIIADIINDYAGPKSMRFWKVVADDYKLAPIFEP